MLPCTNLFWTLKVFFCFYSFYLKNNLFSLFYSGPLDYVKFDVAVGLKESQCLVHTLGEKVDNKFITLFQSISRLANEFDVVLFFAELWCRWDVI